MTDQTVPPEQQLPTVGNTPASTTNWEAAYKSLQTNYNALYAAKETALQGNIAQATQLGNLQATLTNKEAETAAAIAQREQAAKVMSDDLARTKAELQTAQADRIKFDALAKLDVSATIKANLLSLIPHIPSAPTVEAQAEIFKSFATFGTNVAATREAELRQGVTPGFAQGQTTPTTPATTDAWQSQLKATKFGTPEHNALQNQYFDWARKQK